MVDFNKTSLLRKTDYGLLVFQYYHPDVVFDKDDGVYVRHKSRRSGSNDMHIYFWQGKWYCKEHRKNGQAGDMFNYVAQVNKLDPKKDFRKVLIEVNRIIELMNNRKAVDIIMNVT
ncbi:MAG: hypothetical protein KDC11_04935, partial [Chitinophagaceae bacterium]|nr:hypothetical protein [Chitinophagaceae bacterium]